jgi:hypothetical protein
MTVRRHLTTVAVFLVLAAIHTWPLVANPAVLSRVDNGDYLLNAWIMAWVVHQGVRDPAHLFHANIFYPEPRTLAFSEHLLPQSVLAAPVLWAGGSPVLAYNLVLLAGLVLSAWAMCTVVTRWTDDWWAGLLSGSLLAFNAHSLTRLSHIQVQHVQYLPLALLALDQLLQRPRARNAVRLAAWSALQALTSGYMLVFTAVGLAAAVAARARELTRRSLGWLAVAAVLAALVVGPFLIPYWLVRRDQGLVRPLQEISDYSATWVEYVTTAGRLHMLTPLKWGYLEGRGSDTLFPGIVATLLAVVACATGVAWKDRRARMCLAIAIAGVFLSFGPRTGVYLWLYDHVPVFQGIRVVARFGFLALFGIAALAGFTLAAGRRRASWLGPLLLVLVNVEALRAPLWYQRFEGIRPVYRAVARLEDPVVLAEFPFYRPADFYGNAQYMLASTAHWKPMVNGYSGFMPLRYRRLAEAMHVFPDPAATDLLREAGVTHVVIHRNLFGEGRDLLLETMARSGEFALVTGDENIKVYQLLPRNAR